ncbi:MAG: BTAD domain-containing putative transcriptional regulator [Gemmatimonadota bacterium]
MLRLLTLGGLSLADASGREAVAILRRPKRLAFVCLVGASRDWVSRDQILGMLWPDLDEDHARHALRQTLYEVRAALPDGALECQGGAGVRARSDALWCDARVLAKAAREKRHARVRDLYGGEFLPGFHAATPSLAFQEWVEAQRIRLRSLAFWSTWSLALEARAGHDDVLAARLAVEAAELQPYDEIILRDTVRFLTELGDRARALEVYRGHLRRWRADLGVEPADRTVALIEAVRRGGELPEDPGALLSAPAAGS